MLPGHPTLGGLQPGALGEPEQEATPRSRRSEASWGEGVEPEDEPENVFSSSYGTGRREVRRSPSGRWYRVPADPDDAVQGYIFLKPDGSPVNDFRLAHRDLWFPEYCRKYQTQVCESSAADCRREHRCAHCAGNHPAMRCPGIRRQRRQW